MSDALTDISYDRMRAENYNTYLRNLRDYLRKPSKNGYKLLLKSAESTDAVPNGYWNGSTSIAESLDEKIKKLEIKDRKEWAKLLLSAGSYYNELKQLSPFSNKTLVFVDYGSGWARIDFSEIENRIHERIGNADYKTYDCDNYLLALPIPNQNLEEIINKAEVVWMRCGIYNLEKGALGPRNAKGNPRKKNDKN